MIDRYAIYSSFTDINERYGLKGEEFTVPNYNAAPAQQLPVISNHINNEISFFYWGTSKKWSNNKKVSQKLLSADRESLAMKTTLKTALEKKRCLIPINGFYLWKQYGKKRQTAHYFHNTAEELISLPGIWEENEDMEGNIHITFKVIEIPNYVETPQFGASMPGVIPRELESKWLDDYTTIDELFGILQNTDEVRKLTNHPVSANITNISINSDDLIKPQSQVDQLGNYTLFD